MDNVEEIDKFLEKHNFLKQNQGEVENLVRAITSTEVETVADFIFGGSKITADCECTHEIKRHLLLGRRANTYPTQTLSENCRGM